MYFETAGVEVAPWIPPLVALVVSFFTSMGGVSGAFLLLPFQMSFLNFTSPSVSATNFVFNIVAIPSGVYRYLKEGRMAWPLTWVVIIGTLPGVFIGYYLRVLYLPDPRTFKLFVGCVLLYIGTRLLYEMTGKAKTGKSKMKELEDKFRERTKQIKDQQKSRVASGLPPEAVVKTISVSFKQDRIRVLGRKVFIQHHRYVLSRFCSRDNRRHIWDRRRRYHRAILRCCIPSAGLYNCRRCPNGDINNFSGRGSFLQHHSRQGRDGNFTGLAAWFSFRRRRIHRHIPRRPVSEIRASKGHQADAGYDYCFPCNQIYFTVFYEIGGVI